MSIHQKHKHMRDDQEFYPGHIKYLVKGNACRLLDGRRTPGILKEIDYEHAIFTFLITDFEDKGKTWSLYAGEVKKFQFEQSSQTLSPTTLSTLKETIQSYQKKLTIEADTKDKERSKETMRILQKEISNHLKAKGLSAPYTQDKQALQQALIAYMKEKHLDHLEEIISKQLVLNPNAGEVSKQLSISLAMLGFLPYHASILRKAPFDQEEVSRYLIHRLAFTQYLFEDFTVYRGMSSEGPFQKLNRSFVSYTDSLDVAKAFTEFENPRFQSVYLLKKKAKKEELFMTHYETQAFDQTYHEKEVVLLQEEHINL